MALTFSIVIPAYNREKFIERAISSCLVQRHPAFQVIVVDDGSTDRTPAIVSRINDSRLRLFVLPVNQGVSAARNFGISRARGEWIVALDSDDELTPDGLELIDTEVRRVSDDVQSIRFMCRLDDGSLSPFPALQPDVWDFEGYLRWAEKASVHGRQETLTCVRRRTYETVKYSEGALETRYHMDFAARFLTATSPAVPRLYHSDASDQVSRPNVRRALAQAPDHMRNFQVLLDRHGGALARWAPGLLAMYTRALATQQFLAGDRLGGIRTMGRLIRARHVSLTEWAILGFGLLGRRPLAYAQAEHKRRSTSSLPVAQSARHNGRLGS